MEKKVKITYEETLSISNVKYISKGYADSDFEISKSDFTNQPYEFKELVTHFVKEAFSQNKSDADRARAIRDKIRNEYPNERWSALVGLSSSASFDLKSFSSIYIKYRKEDTLSVYILNLKKDSCDC